MRSDRIMQSKIYRLFDYVLRLVLLNVLIVVPSFSLFIIYSAINKSGNNHLTFLLLIPIFLKAKINDNFKICSMPIFLK